MHVRSGHYYRQCHATDPLHRPGCANVDVAGRNEIQSRRRTTGHIAASVNAPEHHVAKAVARLAEFGWASIRRGRTGGVFLTDAGRNIRMGQAIRLLEGDREVIDCNGDRPCPLVACRSRHALAAAKENFYHKLDGYSLNDLTFKFRRKSSSLNYLRRQPGRSKRTSYARTSLSSSSWTRTRGGTVS